MMRALAFVLTTLVGVTAASAQEGAPPDPAKEHYKQGVTHFELGEFDKAAAEFKEAYELSKKPSLLFNLAQAARADGRYDEALHFYRMFLRLEPETKERAFVEERIVEIEREQEARARAAAEQVAMPVPVVTDDPAARKLRVTGLATLGAGVILVGAGTYFAFRAEDAEEELDALYRRGGNWSERYHEVYERGQRDQLTAGVLLGAGAVAMITGGVLTYLGFTSDARTLTITPRGGGAVLGWSAAF